MSASIALALPITQAWAGNYSVTDEAQLRQAISDANSDPDASATITLMGNVTLASTTAFPTATKSITINTNGFALSGFDQISGTATGGSNT